MRDINAYPGVQAWWRSRSHWYSEEGFANCINQLQQTAGPPRLYREPMEDEWSKQAQPTALRFPYAHLRSPTAQRSTRRRSHFRCAAIRSAVVKNRVGVADENGLNLRKALRLSDDQAAISAEWMGTCIDSGLRGRMPPWEFNTKSDAGSVSAFARLSAALWVSASPWNPPPSMNRRATYSMVHGWLPGGGSSPPLSKHVSGSFRAFLRLGKTSEHLLRRNWGGE